MGETKSFKVNDGLQATRQPARQLDDFMLGGGKMRRWWRAPGPASASLDSERVVRDGQRHGVREG